MPRHQLADQQLQPAIGKIDGEQRVPSAVLSLFPDIQESDLTAVREPSPKRRDIDATHLRHRGGS